VKEAYLEIQNHVGIDESKMDQIHRELMPYVVSQCWVITKTAQYTYYYWQPWLKAYHGGGTTGYYDYYGGPKYCWIDLDMRKEMIGK